MQTITTGDLTNIKKKFVLLRNQEEKNNQKIQKGVWCIFGPYLLF